MKPSTIATMIPPAAERTFFKFLAGYGTSGEMLCIIGKPFDESTIFRVGHAYQRLTDWHTREPRP